MPFSELTISKHGVLGLVGCGLEMPSDIFPHLLIKHCDVMFRQCAFVRMFVILIFCLFVCFVCFSVVFVWFVWFVWLVWFVCLFVCLLVCLCVCVFVCLCVCVCVCV